MSWKDGHDVNLSDVECEVRYLTSRVDDLEQLVHTLIAVLKNRGIHVGGEFKSARKIL